MAKRAQAKDRSEPAAPRSKPKAETELHAKAERIMAVLAEHHPAPAVPLDHRNPFELLVAVALSAQTTDAAVNRATPALFELAPDAATLARQPVEAVLALIRTLGLAPTKARNLVRMAELLVLRHGGEVPADFEALEALPGVGHKTASVVMAQAFQVPAFPVDTHIHRCAARWGLSSGANVAETERDLKALFPRERWNELHLQIILFGRSHCSARGHDPLTCPICSFAAVPDVPRTTSRAPRVGKKKTARKRPPRAP